LRLTRVDTERKMNIRAKIYGGNDRAGGSPLIDTKRPTGVRADDLHTVYVARQEVRRGNTRGGDRHRLPEEQVRVTHEGREHRVHLVNLSGGGAMVEGEFEPKLWDRADLHLGEEGRIECAVIWLKGNRIGLEFAHETRLECSADEQAALLREVISRSFKDVEFEAAERPPVEEQMLAEQRMERRHPLIWTGVLHHDFQSIPVRLRNISSSGALVESEHPPRLGSEPLLELGEAGSFFATVSWVVGDQAGLKFHQPFDMTQLARARPEIAPAKWERPTYLRPSLLADSRAADWDRMSLAELHDHLEGYMKR